MYGFTNQLERGVDAAVAKVTEALTKEGVAALTDFDVKATQKARPNVTRRPYRIRGACDPLLTRRQINADADIGLQGVIRWTSKS